MNVSTNCIIVTAYVLYLVNIFLVYGVLLYYSIEICLCILFIIPLMCYLMVVMVMVVMVMVVTDIVGIEEHIGVGIDDGK